MKVVIVGDLQTHQWAKYPETSYDGQNLRLLDTVRELRRICELCTRNKVEMVCILGDIFEARNALQVNVLNAVSKAFYEYVSNGIKLVLLVGNHDRTDVGKEHALEVFKPWCTVVDRPTVLADGDGNIVAIPFHPKPEAVVRAIENNVTNNTKLLLLHTGIQSLTLPSGKVWGDGITLQDIPLHVQCLLGHYHRHTELRTGRVWFLGSMLQVDHGDAGTDKFFALYDSDKNKVYFKPTKGPKFVTTSVEGLPDRRKDNSELIEKYYLQVNGNFVKVDGVPPDTTEFGPVKQFLLNCGARHVEFALQTQLPQGAFPVDTQGNTIVDATNVVKRYVDETETPLDKDHLVETGVEILSVVDTVDTELEEPVDVN